MSECHRCKCLTAVHWPGNEDHRVATVPQTNEQFTKSGLLFTVEWQNRNTRGWNQSGCVNYSDSLCFLCSRIACGGASVMWFGWSIKTPFRWGGGEARTTISESMACPLCVRGLSDIDCSSARTAVQKITDRIKCPHRVRCVCHKCRWNVCGVTRTPTPEQRFMTTPVQLKAHHIQ